MLYYCQDERKDKIKRVAAHQDNYSKEFKNSILKSLIYFITIPKKFQGVIKMTKNEIANQINANIKNICRQISTNYKLELKEDDIIILEKAESWTDGGEFTVENEREYEYLFYCVNECPAHVVDYENEEECEILGATDCEEEAEVLVPAGTKFKVIFVSSDDDYEEMGYYEIQVEYVN